MTDRISIVSDLRIEADSTAERAEHVLHHVSDVEHARELGLAMRHRSAETHFADRSIQRRDVEAMVAAMTAIDQSLWGSVARDVPLRILIGCRSVDGLQPGLYEATAAGPMRIDRQDEPLRMREMVLQPEFAEAAAIVLAVGNLAEMTDRYAAHGHRMLLSRGGAASEAAWLTAVGLGLTGSIFAGFLPSALRRLSGIDGSSDLQLLALAVGAAR